MKEITPDNQGIGKISQPARPRQTTSKGSGFTGEFSKILSDHLASEQTPASTETGGLPELDATYASKIAGLARTDTALMSQRVSGAIDLLDQYAGCLADPESTLKHAFSLLEEISDRATDINKELNAAENKDSRIKEIMAHLDTVVALEKIKINRGDYS
ncbi:MAG: hypothetical protein HUN04_02985 [Desulfobacter sp.]|nr:MAG: hypothetical protein HUN04_02985 [Desulfobacter sp.]